MGKRVMNVLTVLAVIISLLFFSVLDFSLQALMVSLVILLPIVVALNYIFFGKLTIWHETRGS